MQDNRYDIQRGDYDVTIVRYPGRTQAALFDLVVEQGAQLGPFTVHLQEGIDPENSIDLDLTGAAISIMIEDDPADPMELTIGDGITVDNPSNGRFTFVIEEAETDDFTTPRIRWMCTLTAASVTRRWFEGVLETTSKVG